MARSIYGYRRFCCCTCYEYSGERVLWLPLPLLPLVGGLVGLGFATIIGSFSTRKAGTVFAMISLGIGELIAACCIIITVFFGGEEGISGDRTMAPPTFGIEFITQKEVYFLIAFGSSFPFFVCISSHKRP